MVMSGEDNFHVEAAFICYEFVKNENYKLQVFQAELQI